jgi:hypothetical protein
MSDYMDYELEEDFFDTSAQSGTARSGVLSHTMNFGGIDKAVITIN